MKMQTIQKCWEPTGIIPRASFAEISMAACGAEAEVVEEIQKDIQGFRTISSDHLMSACDFLDLDSGICTSQFLSVEAIVNQPTQCNSESKSNDDETENPPRAMTTNKGISAIFTLSNIVFFQKPPIILTVCGL